MFNWVKKKLLFTTEDDNPPPPPPLPPTTHEDDPIPLSHTTIVARPISEVHKFLGMVLVTDVADC